MFAASIRFGMAASSFSAPAMAGFAAAATSAPATGETKTPLSTWVLHVAGVALANIVAPLHLLQITYEHELLKLELSTQIQT
jgi:hypothetical protein